MADENASTANLVDNPNGATYTKEVLATSKKYRTQCDLIMCVLKPDKKYTEKEVEKELNSFLKNEIKEKVNGKE
ncbi:hypothetical protein [Pectinatus frisingensis]|uniref:hypothetical protein n=1 Tax=Pectinatus frisingensis TaxID=865 RepID=UPI0018C46081|nr:hypothetical protein [Pectinatus frisingensis]